MGADDWFGRERGLGEGEAANLVYAADFDANEIELLELPDDLLQRAREGEELIFKGAPDEEAVLCTSDATYLLKRVETSNTLLLMRGASGVINDRREDEDEADEQDATRTNATPSVETTGKRRRVSDASAGGPVTPVTEPRPARTVAAFAANEDGQPDLIAHAQAESHLELQLTEPRLERAWRLLSAPPHAFAGTDGDDDDDVEIERGLTEEAILDMARASKKETLDALEAGPAFLDPATNRWRGVDEGYLDHLLDVLCVVAEAKGWPLSATPLDDACDALFIDGFPRPLTAYALARFFERVDGSSSFAARAASICAFKAGRLLDAPANAAGGAKWRLDAFVDRWRARVPEPFRDACEASLLAGLALVEKASQKGENASDKIVRPLKASSLPRDPKARFAALFAFKPRWTLEELAPYVVPTADATVEAQLLKFTRVTQPDAKATAVYSKR